MADRVVVLTHAVKGEQGYVDLEFYKQQGIDSPLAIRQACLLYLVSRYHWDCIQGLSSRPIDGVVPVPSTKGRVDHPLLSLTRFLPIRAPFIPFTVGCDTDAAARIPKRVLRQSVFTVGKPQTGRPPGETPEEGGPPLGAPVLGRHVLVLEDTWVTGSNAQSVSMALKAAGAAEVTILVMGRCLSPGWADTDSYLTMNALPTRYSIEVCPVTRGACP